jgi:hypothetical protein
MLTVKRCGRFHKQSKNGDYVQFYIIYACMFGFQQDRASGEAESRDNRVEADNRKRRKVMEGGPQLRKS